MVARGHAVGTQGSARSDESRERCPQIVRESAEDIASLAFNVCRAPRARGLTTQTLCDHPGHCGNEQENRQRHGVLRVRDGKPPYGRNEQKVEYEAPADDGRNRGSDAESRCHHENTQREDEDESGGVEERRAGDRKLSAKSDDRDCG